MASRAERELRKLTLTAFHEAGHAVACIKFGRSFHHVTINPKEGSLGHILLGRFAARLQPHRDMGPKQRVAIDDQVLIDMAGMAAEKRFGGRKYWSGGGGDRQSSINLASFLYSDPHVLGSYLRFKIAEAESFMRSSVIWAQVEAVAAALVEHRTLDSDQVRGVCQKVILDGSRIKELRDEMRAEKAQAV